MKIISKKDALILSIIAAVLIIAVLLADPTPVVKWRAKRHSAALARGVRNGCSTQWKCFYDLRKLKKRGHYFDAEKVFVKVYSKIAYSSDNYILDLLSIYAEILRALPQNAVVITEGSDETYPFWFLQIVQDIRYDVIVINRHLWHLPEYRKFLWKTTSLKNVISKDEFLLSPQKIGNGDTSTNLSAIAHELAKYYSVFVSLDGEPEFPEDSLYYIPSAMAKLYSPKTLSDTAIGTISFEMLREQNFNYLAENPPAATEKYSNRLTHRTSEAVINTIMLLHKTDRDSLAQYIFKKFDSWMMWNVEYVSSRKSLKQIFQQKTNAQQQLKPAKHGKKRKSKKHR